MADGAFLIFLIFRLRRQKWAHDKSVPGKDIARCLRLLRQPYQHQSLTASEDAIRGTPSYIGLSQARIFRGRLNHRLTVGSRQGQLLQSFMAGRS